MCSEMRFERQIENIPTKCDHQEKNKMLMRIPIDGPAICVSHLFLFCCCLSWAERVERAEREKWIDMQYTHVCGGRQCAQINANQ